MHVVPDGQWTPEGESDALRLRIAELLEENAALRHKAAHCAEQCNRALVALEAASRQPGGTQVSRLQENTMSEQGFRPFYAWSMCPDCLVEGYPGDFRVIGHEIAMDEKTVKWAPIPCGGAFTRNGTRKDMPVGVLINLTPHTLTLQGGTDPVVLPPSPPAARISVTQTPLAPVAGLPVVAAVMGEVENLPEPVPGIGYVVSRLVFEACPSRRDVFAPGAPLANKSGVVIGAQGLVGR